jgi:hypothetical protein
MGLKEDQIAKMTLLQKWTTVLQFQEKQSDSTTLENKPVEVVKELEKGKNKIKTLVRVRTLLTTETVDWCTEFIKLKGHQRLFDIFIATSEKKYVSHLKSSLFPIFTPPAPRERPLDPIFSDNFFVLRDCVILGLAIRKRSC